MLDIALAWGLTQGAGILLKPVVEELVTDATKDWFKDMFKNRLSNVLKLPQQEPLEKCEKKAIKLLAEHFKDDGDLFDILFQCAKNDSFEGQEFWEPNARQTALK